MSDLEAPLTAISSKPPFMPNIAEIWRYRALAVMLARRNIKVRYRQTVFGGVWVVLQPLLLTGLLTVVLGMLLQVPSGGLPYVVFSLGGTTIWSIFQRALIEATTSIASSGNLILKVYFPRILIPASTVLATVADLIPIYAILVVTVAAYGLLPGWPLLASPIFLLLTLLMAFAIGLWMTILDAVFRDIRLVTPAMLGIVMYLSPIMYSETAVPERWRALYNLNPLVGVIQGFRWSTIAGATTPDVFGILWSCGFVVLITITGLMVFTRLENFAVDRI
jgi:lipopolysaccharide transport system permease protein